MIPAFMSNIHELPIKIHFRSFHSVNLLYSYVHILHSIFECFVVRLFVELHSALIDIENIIQTSSRILFWVENGGISIRIFSDKCL